MIEAPMMWRRTRAARWIRERAARGGMGVLGRAEAGFDGLGEDSTGRTVEDLGDVGMAP